MQKRYLSVCCAPGEQTCAEPTQYRAAQRAEGRDPTLLWHGLPLFLAATPAIWRSAAPRRVSVDWRRPDGRLPPLSVSYSRDRRSLAKPSSCPVRPGSTNIAAMIGNSLRWMRLSMTVGTRHGHFQLDLQVRTKLILIIRCGNVASRQEDK